MVKYFDTNIYISGIINIIGLWPWKLYKEKLENIFFYQ